MSAIAAFIWALAPIVARAEDSSASVVRLFTDADRGTAAAGHATDGAEDTEWVSSPGAPFVVRSIRGAGIRVIAGKRSVTEAMFEGGIRAKRIGLQGLEPGAATVDLGTRSLDLEVCEVTASDSTGERINLARSHASLSRTLPPPMSIEAGQGEDGDALAWTIVCPSKMAPASVRIESFRPSGDPLDAIETVPLTRSACPALTAPGLECAGTGPVRAVVDAVDRDHPAGAARSLRAEVGGRLVLSAFGKRAAAIGVGGPRKTALGELERFRGYLRFHVVRGKTRAQMPVESGEIDEARNLARDEARTASMLWGQCGIHFGPDEEVSVDVVDPPGPYLLAVGCDVGLPASGGTLSILADGKPIRVATKPGDPPVTIAVAVARAAAAAGFSATVSPNARIATAALRTADVLFRRKNGQLADLSVLPEEPASSDATLGACISEVNLDDGLEHFDDLDAIAGTLEERALIKAYEDDDPKTIEVFVVPSFSKTGRIGESFIDSDGSSIQNAIIVDRAGIRAGARSYALAHEIGHVLLDLPGHPDDFGVDRPWVLMDADAADPTVFGPRRLSVEECERAIRESGPGSPLPLLTAWPLTAPKAKQSHASAK